MNTEYVKMILRAAELNSMSKAAEEFSYTASAFSHIADTVEEELGIKIITRTHHGTFLTDDGKRLFEKMENLIKAEKELKIESSIMQSEKTIIRIGTFSSVSKYILPKILKNFMKKFPETKISIFVNDNLLDLLQNDLVDIILSDNDETKNIKKINLFKDKFLAVFPDSFKTQNGEIKKDELYNNTFIMPSDSHVKQYFDTKKFKKIIEINSEDDILILQMVKENLGITVLPTLSVKNHIKGIKTIKLYPSLERDMGLLYIENSKKRKTIKKFIEYMKENFNKN